MVTAADRLHLYDVNRLLTTFTDINELLRVATRRGRAWSRAGCSCSSGFRLSASRAVG
jgi:hypothetical protein